MDEAADEPMRQEKSLLPSGPLSPPELKRLTPRLRHAWEVFVSDGGAPTPEVVRPLIYSRWRAAVGSGVPPLLSRVPMAATEEELEPLFVGNDFATAGRRVLEDMSGVVAENDHALFLTDAGGCVLHVTGEPSVVEALRDLNARAGGRWDEAAAGPNGMGTTLLTAMPSMVFGAEHFCERWHPWVCYGAPVHDPIDGRVLGVVNLTGWAEKARASQLPLTIGLARAVEYLLISSRGSWRQALLDQGRELASSYPSDGVLLCDAAGNVLQMNARVPDLLRSRGATVHDLLRHPSVAGLVKGGARDSEAVVSLPDGRLYARMCSIERAGRRMGAAFVLRSAATPLPSRSSTVSVSEGPFAELAGEHPVFLEVLRLAARAARCDETVLITGETGTGKGMIAAAMHRASDRARGPFVAVDCAALPRELAESELFGYEPGAFTGAHGAGKRGRFELAHSGTLFLDEIGELPPELQSKLLRALEERAVFRVGGSRARPLDVRILAATNRDLEGAVAEGAFRLDLYHRLAVLEIAVPPLRARGRDVLRLARRFLEEASLRARRRPPRLGPDIEERLLRHSWPGNLRELRNVTAHVAHWTEGDEVRLTDLPRRLFEARATRVPTGGDSLRAIEREVLRRTLEACGGNASAAARRLGIDRSTIYRRLKQRPGGRG